ncbi:MAG TPA: TadE/TadG family type IV pilus assembly protein [Natronosporangium sp.]|nr:TadE/TadG family type IV pilus assembly protein [Natronosporangium sp.]
MSGAAGRRAAAPAVRGQVTGPAVRADGGGGPIELAIMLPLLLMCVFATAHASMYVLARQAAMSIAQVAVDAERSYGSVPGDGLRRAERFTALLPSVLRDVSVTLTCDGEPLVGTCDGEQVAATVTGTAVAVIPWLEHRVSRTATGPVERVSAP